jgi:hypothetical protein
MDESKDQLERRCPRLGGPITFQYCRLCGDTGLPCWKIFDCWWEDFDITDFLKENLPGDSFDRLIDTKPKPKLNGLIELIEQVKQRAGRS